MRTLLGFLLYALSTIVGMPIATVIIVAVAFVMPATANAAQMIRNPTPFKETCVGILKAEKGFLFLDTGNRTTDEHLPRWIEPFDLYRDIICTTPLTSKAAMAKTSKGLHCWPRLSDQGKNQRLFARGLRMGAS